jgi:biopolymer transport protein TolR
MSYRDRKRKQMADINVVPYIDVMLVLLIIFMVTAPLLTEGVQVDLPQLSNNPIPRNQDAPEPMVLTVDVDGIYYVDDLQKSSDEIKIYAAAYLLNNPSADFFVRGDKAAVYNDVLQAMVLLKDAGVESVSLVTETPTAAEVE